MALERDLDGAWAAVRGAEGLAAPWERACSRAGGEVGMSSGEVGAGAVGGARPLPATSTAAAIQATEEVAERGALDEEAAEVVGDGTWARAPG